MITIQIKQLVDAKFENMNQFAKAIGIAHQAAENIYKGKITKISLDTIESLCVVLECTPNDIFISDKIQLNSITENKQSNIELALPQPGGLSKAIKSTKKFQPSQPSQYKYDIRTNADLYNMISDMVDIALHEKIANTIDTRSVREKIHDESWKNIIPDVNPDGGK